MDATRIPYQAYRMLVSLDSDGKCNWVTKLRLLLHETGFGYVWLAQGVGDEQHFIRVFIETETADRYQFPGLGHLAGLNASSRFDHYREFKTALKCRNVSRLYKAKMLQKLFGSYKIGY